MNNPPEPPEAAPLPVLVGEKPSILPPNSGWQWAVGGIAAYFLPVLMNLGVLYEMLPALPDFIMWVGVCLSVLLEVVALVLALKTTKGHGLFWAVLIVVGMLTISLVTLYVMVAEVGKW